MRSPVLLASIFLICLNRRFQTQGRTLVSVDEHMLRREEILKKEHGMMYGENIKLNPDEEIANSILMQAKYREYDDGFIDVAKFNPAFHFFVRKPQIEKSEVFKMIKDLPKGAALHLHDTGLLGKEFVLNITYRPDLYICCINDDIQFKFSRNTPTDNKCDWILMEEHRNNQEDVEEFDKELTKLFTTEVDDPIAENLNDYESWAKFANIFMVTLPLLTYKPVWEEYFYEVLRQFREDNILYIELRTVLPHLYDFDGNTYDEIECAKSLKVVHDRFIKDYPDFFGMRIIFAPHRAVSKTVVKNYIEITKKIREDLGDFIAGFDLVGQEDLGKPLIDFIEELVNIPENIDVFYHAGETKWFGTTTDYNLIDAALLGAKRIGHGFGLLKHPAVSNLIKEKDIVLEVNPISNQVLGYISDLRNHPAVPLFAENYTIIISSDDPGLFGSLPLSHDMYEAFMGMASRRSDIRFLKQLALNSIQHSSMPPQQMSAALESFNQQWDQAIKNIIQTYGGSCATDSCESGNDDHLKL